MLARNADGLWVHWHVRRVRGAVDSGGGWSMPDAPGDLGLVVVAVFLLALVATLVLAMVPRRRGDDSQTAGRRSSPLTGAGEGWHASGASRAFGVGTLLEGMKPVISDGLTAA